MRLRMLWYQFRMLTIRDGVKRTAYLKKRNVYAGIGENVMIQSRKIPLYPELIRIGNNVRMASNVLFVTHDVVHNMLNRISPKTEKILVGGVFHEKVGCIEIGNNVFIGANTTILPGVTIGDNVIIGANGVVTKDIPENSVAIGNPCRVIKEYNNYMYENKKIMDNVPVFDEKYIIGNIDEKRKREMREKLEKTIGFVK